MAPRPTYDPPHVQLGELMLKARRRGLSFEQWWEEAVRPQKSLIMVTHPNPPEGAVRWPTDRNDRETWKAAIRGSKAGWRRAYERCHPTRQEEALRYLGEDLGVLEEVMAERTAVELDDAPADLAAAA